MNIAEFENIVPGGEVVILGNGPSLLEQIPYIGDVDRITEGL